MMHAHSSYYQVQPIYLAEFVDLPVGVGHLSLYLLRLELAEGP